MQQATFKAGHCPRCGGALRYSGNPKAWDDGCSYPVECTKCPWKGYEDYKGLFDGHTTGEPARASALRPQDQATGIGWVMGLLVSPPPAEGAKGLQGPGQTMYRVVYVIDIDALNPRHAAEQVYEIMQDPNSIPPLLDVLDCRGGQTQVDLADNESGDGQ